MREQHQTIDRLQRQLRSAIYPEPEATAFGRLLGNSPALRNAIERAVLLSQDDQIRLVDLPRCLVQRARTEGRGHHSFTRSA